MPKQPEPLFERGNKVQILETHTTKRQTVVQKGAIGIIKAVQESRSKPGLFYYGIDFEDGTKEQGIEEEMIDFA